MRVRRLEERDFEAFRTLFDEAFSEYLEFLRRENPEQFRMEVAGREQVTREGFDFYLKTGVSFVAEQVGRAIGYVAARLCPRYLALTRRWKSHS